MSWGNVNGNGRLAGWPAGAGLAAHGGRRRDLHRRQRVAGRSCRRSGPTTQCIIRRRPAGSIRHDRGILDVALDKPYGYELFPLVANNLQPIAAEGEIEPNRVSVTGAQVKIVPPPGVNVAFSEACAAEFDYHQPRPAGPRRDPGPAASRRSAAATRP